MPSSANIAFIGSITLLLFVIIPIYYPFLGHTVYLLNHYSTQSSSPPPPFQNEEWIIGDDDKNDDGIKFCDLFSGEWVPNPEGPYYTNSTCSAIYTNQDCLKHGRPDGGFLKWRWKPDGCDLPVFNPVQFLEMLRGKSIAFVGDSLAGNQIQSLICLLSSVSYPVTEHTPDPNYRLYNYTYFNFTFALFWTPHLVRTVESVANGPTQTNLFNLYLDEFDQTWTSRIHNLDYLVISAGAWFFRSSVYHENNKISGCHYCLLDNVPDLTHKYGYRKAIRTAFKAILENFNGVTFLRTLAPPHFENGPWDKGGNCNRTAPFKRNESTPLETAQLDLYKIQVEEFKAAKKEGKKNGKKFRLMDTLKPMLLRPDGHPNKYGHDPSENVTINDCLHWCVPGPIDVWNDLLLEMLKVEDVRSYAENMFSSGRKLR